MRFLSRSRRFDPDNKVALLFNDRRNGKVTFKISGLEYARKVSLAGSLIIGIPRQMFLPKIIGDDGTAKSLLSQVFMVGDDNWMDDPANKLVHNQKSNPGR